MPDYSPAPSDKKKTPARQGQKKSAQRDAHSIVSRAPARTWTPFSELAGKLAALDTAGVKALFAAKSIASLEALGLEKDYADGLRAILASGTEERTLFLLFLERLLRVNADDLAGSAIAPYISRGCARLSGAEKTLPPEAQKMLDDLFVFYID